VSVITAALLRLDCLHDWQTSARGALNLLAALPLAVAARPTSFSAASGDCNISVGANNSADVTHRVLTL